jgi:disulfide bond formation protein DsbB
MATLNDTRAWRPWLVLALLLSLAALVGSLALSLGLNLRACPLCFYQRTFAMALVGVLGMGLITGLARSDRFGLIAVPLAVGGLGVALFHVYLELTGTLECPEGLFGLGTAPQQSLVTFAAILGLLVGDVAAGPEGAAGKRPAFIGSLILGGLLAVASCIANPPMPAAPSQAYPGPPDICRPPYAGT